MSNLLNTTPQPQASLLGDYLSFLRHPTNDLTPGTTKETFIKVWRIYTFHLVLLTPTILLIQVLSNWITSIEKNQVGTLLETLQPSLFLLLVVVVAPLSEELVFRTPLRFSRQNFTILLAFFLFPVGIPFIQSFDPVAIGWGFWFIFWGLGTTLFYLVLGRINRRTGEQCFARHLTALVYCSAILFGLVHVMNYPKQAWIVAPILVLPQTVLGFLFAYVRIRFGLRWSMITHALHNFLVSGPILFMAFGSSQFQQKFLNKATDVELLPHDRVLEGVIGIWYPIVGVLVIITFVKLIQEWNQAKIQREAL